MNSAEQARPHRVQQVALVLVIVAYWLAREPAVDPVERRELASRFHFSPVEIEVEPHAPRPLMTTRQVHPSLKRNQAWIAATGAAATLADLDRDGLYNDLLLVDARVNSVLVMPVPGTGNRYAPFALDPIELAFDPSTMSPTGTLVGDFNEDGAQDVLVHYWGRTPVIFVGHDKSPSRGGHSPTRADFSPTELIPTEGERPPRWYTHAATRADIDGDGHLDLLFGNFFQDGADILNPWGTGTATVMHAGKSRATNGGGAKLLLWDSVDEAAPPNVSFHDASSAIEEHCGTGWVLAIGAADLDPNSQKWTGLPEIYIAHDFGPDRLLHNRSTPGEPRFAVCEGRRRFTTPKSFVLGHDSFKGMGLDFADVNEDGLFDMYVSNIADDFALHESHFLFTSTGATSDFATGRAPYEQSSERHGLSRSGWGWDCRLVDFDNDGHLEAIQATGFTKGTINAWPELHALGTTNDQLVSDPRFWPRFTPGVSDLSGDNPNPLFVRAANGRFVDIAPELGLDQPWNTRALAIADVDGDGWQDVVAANQWEPSIFIHNQSHRTSTRNTFIALHLVLPPINSPHSSLTVLDGHPLPSSSKGDPAIGAIATVKTHDGRTLTSLVDGGSGHSGRRAPVVHFGLGDDPRELVPVTINWRDRSGRQHSSDIEVRSGHWHTVLLAKSDETK